jgi:DNA-binding MarR family transcriptional regulator/GNAT superfamily N-acetyltransferase
MVVDVLRRFNRSYTQRIGVLADSYLESGRPLGPSRLLFEVAEEGSSVRDLRRRLGLDSGYVSRLLRQLEADGLVTVVAAPGDRRQRLLLLTSAGRRERRTLDRRADRLAQQLIEPLSERQRADLAGALDTVDRLLRAATVEFDAVDVGSTDARRMLQRYFAELDARFPEGFDADLARDEGGEAAALAPPGGAFVLIRSDGEPVGCGGLQRLDSSTAEIKRMWVHPQWRGLGLGRRLVECLERIADAGGYRRVVLDTNASLVEAIAMYEAMGYVPIERYNENPYAQRWFDKPLG